MKLLALLPILCLLAFAAADSYQFQQDSTLEIAGTSNVRGWSCEASQMAGTMVAFTQDQRLSSVEGVTVTIPVQGIECGNGQMNGKVRESLGADNSNFVRFNLSNATVSEADAQGRSTVSATGRLSIAGTTRTIQIPAQAQAMPGNRIRVTGAVPMKMTDFGVTPPTAMLGALRTADDVTVNFDVVVAR
jgi:polyisoprenoid-binding protein YceI